MIDLTVKDIDSILNVFGKMAIPFKDKSYWMELEVKLLKEKEELSKPKPIK